ncbi:hypothetical protein, partial [Mixta theicola]
GRVGIESTLFKTKMFVRLKIRQRVALLAETSIRAHENSAACRINTGFAVEESGADDRICALKQCMKIIFSVIPQKICALRQAQ